MKVETLVVGMFQENVWLAVCPETAEAVIVDPGEEAERIADLVDRVGARPVRILNTHAHIDHVGAVEELRQRYGIPFGVHEKERDVLERLEESARIFGLSAPPRPEVDFEVAEGEEYGFGSQTLRVLETPGHTPGGVSYHHAASNRIFVGDTLFRGSIGRTDLPGGDFATLRDSIREKLFALPPETTAHCGHGPDTVIRVEKATNPFVGDGANPGQFGLL